MNRGSATLGRTRKGPTCSLPGTVFTTPSRETQNVWLTGGSGRGLGALERVLWRGPPLNLPPGNVWPGRVWRELAGSPGEGGVFLGRSPVPTAWAHPLSPFISTSEVRLCPRVPTGPRAGDYTYREGLEHKCKRDILLGRLRSSEDQTWKRIRPRPTKTSFVGSYYLCKGGWAAAGVGGTAGASLLSRPAGLCPSSRVDGWPFTEDESHTRVSI